MLPPAGQSLSPEAAAPHLAARGRSRNAGPLGGGAGPPSRAQEGPCPEPRGPLRGSFRRRARPPYRAGGPPPSWRAPGTSPWGRSRSGFLVFLLPHAPAGPRASRGAFFVQIRVLGSPRVRRGGLGSEESGAPRRAPPRGLRGSPRRSAKEIPRKSRGTKEEGVAPCNGPGN